MFVVLSTKTQLSFLGLERFRLLVLNLAALLSESTAVPPTKGQQFQGTRRALLRGNYRSELPRNP